MKREDYESETALKILRFLENLIHQPKEWISGAKLKLTEMKFAGLTSSEQTSSLSFVSSRNGNDSNE